MTKRGMRPENSVFNSVSSGNSKSPPQCFEPPGIDWAGMVGLPAKGGNDTTNKARWIAAATQYVANVMKKKMQACR